MKKIVVLLVLVSLFSCSLSDDTPRSYTEILPIESVSLPNEFVVNQTHRIDMTYYLPSSCHIFNNIYYSKNQNERIIAIVTEVYPDSTDCQEISTETEASFNFRPTELGFYTFKFWQGETTINSLTEDTYLIYKIEVVE